jgi:hypothetical protein
VEQETHDLPVGALGLPVPAVDFFLFLANSVIGALENIEITLQRVYFFFKICVNHASARLIGRNI